jgi:hypothetical protein
MLDTSWAGGPLVAFTAVWRGMKMGKGCWRIVASEKKGIEAT